MDHGETTIRKKSNVKSRSLNREKPADRFDSTINKTLSKRADSGDGSKPKPRKLKMSAKKMPVVSGDKNPAGSKGFDTAQETKEDRAEIRENFVEAIKRRNCLKKLSNTQIKGILQLNGSLAIHCIPSSTAWSRGQSVFRVN